MGRAIAFSLSLLFLSSCNESPKRQNNSAIRGATPSVAVTADAAPTTVAASTLSAASLEPSESMPPEKQPSLLSADVEFHANPGTLTIDSVGNVSWASPEVNSDGLPIKMTTINVRPGDLGFKMTEFIESSKTSDPYHTALYPMVNRLFPGMPTVDTAWIGRKQPKAMVTGELRVVVVWASWCPASKDFLAQLARFEKDLAPGLSMIGVCSGGSDAKEMANIVKATGVGFPNAFTSGRVVSGALSQKFYPACYLIDSRGVIIVPDLDINKLGMAFYAYTNSRAGGSLSLSLLGRSATARQKFLSCRLWGRPGPELNPSPDAWLGGRVLHRKDIVGHTVALVVWTHKNPKTETPLSKIKELTAKGYVVIPICADDAPEDEIAKNLAATGYDGGICFLDKKRIVTKYLQTEVAPAITLLDSRYLIRCSGCITESLEAGADWVQKRPIEEK